MRGKNAGDQVVLGFSFASEWLDEWREFFWTNQEARCNKAKENCSYIYITPFFHLYPFQPKETDTKQ